MKKWLAFGVIMLAVCFAGGGVAQEKGEQDNVAGVWEITMTYVRGTAVHTATIVQEDGKLSGTYKGQFFEGTLRGTVEGNKVEFMSRLNYMQWGVPYEYTGTIQGDTIKGTVEMSEYWSAPFTAVRKK